MVLDLKGVFECEGYIREFSYEFDMDGSQGQSEGFREPVKVKGFVRNRAGIVGLHVDSESWYHTECDRCCVPISEHLQIAFDNVLVRELSGSDDSDDIIAVQNEKLDLDELVSSNIILNLPMKHLCSESCRGLCPVCGKNLNEGDCGCIQKNK